MEGEQVMYTYIIFYIEGGDNYDGRVIKVNKHIVTYLRGKDWGVEEKRKKKSWRQEEEEEEEEGKANPTRRFQTPKTRKTDGMKMLGDLPLSSHHHQQQQHHMSSALASGYPTRGDIHHIPDALSKDM
ncbi:uncharacterized protein MCYG_01270 [Microsporum canis CBS 113480]|uniref:Uncharacterized protein n=1 Tax=Arthroderma otae (strain ATCC MYA-4605 / CBS 113480) TaxID=554155 RepID=C5FEQ8_ARTOC|nr:uncharacterized protein MCYG_01270 [Microsporum canis CBS 113480]EEQ28382.1 predicted protein [Microsporum canis CBS 113480]